MPPSDRTWPAASDKNRWCPQRSWCAVAERSAQGRRAMRGRIRAEADPGVPWSGLFGDCPVLGLRLKILNIVRYPCRLQLNGCTRDCGLTAWIEKQAKGNRPMLAQRHRDRTIVNHISNRELAVHHVAGKFWQSALKQCAFERQPAVLNPAGADVVSRSSFGLVDVCRFEDQHNPTAFGCKARHARVVQFDNPVHFGCISAEQQLGQTYRSPVWPSTPEWGCKAKRVWPNKAKFRTKAKPVRPSTGLVTFGIFGRSLRATTYGKPAQPGWS